MVLEALQKTIVFSYLHNLSLAHKYFDDDDIMFDRTYQP